MLTARALLAAIKTAEWFRYEGSDPGYVTAGTTGADAITLRATLPASCTDTPQAIEYQHVGEDTWIPSGYAGYPHYDATRDITEDTDGYAFWPYVVTELQGINRR